MTQTDVEVKETAAERGKHDLFFLASVILGQVYPDLTEGTHRPLCEFFVKKDSRRKFELQDLVKNRMLLAPRGHYKTSMDLVDAIQWMLNFSNITILMMSGSKDLASRMVEEMKSIFLQCTDFRAIYPEYIPKENIKEFGANGEFTLPNRTRIRREPTISISTLDSVKASIHVDLRIGDDCVNEINSRSNTGQKVDQNKKVIDDWNSTKALLNPGGYTQIIGTFYNFSCLYGERIDKLGLSDKVRFGHPFIDTVKGWKIYILPAVQPDKDGNLFNIDGILFPQKFCVNANADPMKFNLEECWEDDPEWFHSQYMNFPKSISEDHFPLELLKQQTIPIERVPMSSVMFAAWDLAHTENKKSNFTVGAVGAFDALGNIYVIDLYRGRYNPFIAIEKIIECWRKWPLQRQGLENATGMPMLMPGLVSRSRDLNLVIPIDPLKVPFGKNGVVKEILALSPFLQQKKLWFVNSLPNLPELYLEFSRYGKYSFDDIPRAVSLLLHYVGKAQVTAPQNTLDPPEIGGAMSYGDDPVCGAGIVA